MPKKNTVRKSLIVISVLGLGACFALSLMMRQVVELDGERREAPFLPALRAKFGPQLAQPLRLREESTPTGARWVATAKVAAEVDGARLAESIGSEVWMHTQRAGTAPNEVLVRLQGEESGAVTTVSVPPPQLLR